MGNAYWCARATIDPQLARGLGEPSIGAAPTSIPAFR